VQIAPSTLNFSTAGQQATQTATITNTGSAAVSVTQLSSSSSEFSTSGINVPLSLAPGASARFQVAFRGSTTGTVSGTLTAMTAHGSRSRVKLSGGSNTAPQLSLSTTSVNYGSVLLHSSSKQGVTLQNSGQSAINISQLNVSGSAFSVSGLAVPATIPAGQSVVLEATFSPAAAGSVTGSLTITSNAQNPSATVALSGTGVAASYNMALSPASVNFGNVNVGSTATQTVTLSNTGNSGITISQLSASGSGISVSGLTAGATLTPSQSVALSLTYKPTASGGTTGSLSVTNSQGVSVSDAVAGSAVQAGISVTPTSANFGSVVTGNANTQTIQVSNNGTATLTISQAAVSGAGFSVRGLSLPLNLAPSQATNFNVQYAPTTAATVTGSLAITSNASGSPVNVPLSGTGVAASNTLSVSPASLSFSSVNDGSTSSKSLTLTNTGNSNVAISGVSITGTGFSILNGSGAVTLSPNQIASVSVQFAPATAGPATGSVTISSNATGSPASVSLSGTGVAPVSHSVALGWGASSSGVAGYNVYRSTVNGSSYSKVNSALLPGLSYSDSSVTSGTTYYYVATSVDSSGNESVYSNQVSATIP
jgi:hypothetical protein